MADESFTFKIVTPSGAVLETVVSEVVVPAENGEVGILPGHVLYTGLLGTGILRYKPLTGPEQSLVVSGGFCSFQNATLTVLTDAADFVEGIDRENYAKDRQKLEREVSEISTFEPEWEYASKELARIEAIDLLLSH